MTATSNYQTLTLAVCVFPGVMSLDYVGAVDVFGAISPKALAQNPTRKTPYAISVSYIAVTLDPIEPSNGPLFLPTVTYKDTIEQFDILLIPGGAGARPENVDPSLTAFIKRQAPGAKYVLSVCTGSWILAVAGVLDGKRATSNKATYKQIVEHTKDLSITWVPSARWVVNDDNKIWTSSGVTAGMDMAMAFLEFLVGKELAAERRGIIELSEHARDVDEFAEYYRLV